MDVSRSVRSEHRGWRWLCAPVLCLALCGNTVAGEWYLVYASGKKPDRRVYLARDDEQAMSTPALDAVIGRPGVTGPGRRADIELLEVFEAKNAPDHVKRMIRFTCNADIATQSAIAMVLRDGRSEIGGEQQWASLSESWLQRARRFACMPQDERLEANQVASLGELEELELIDAVWANFWKDGSRPVVADASLEESQAALQDKLAQLKKMQQDLRANVGGQLSRQRAENERVARNAARRGQRLPALGTWIRARDTELFARWGAPVSDSGVAADRDVVYRFQESSVQRFMQGGAIVGENWTHLHCDVGFNIYEGVVMDYWSDGDSTYCRSVTISFSR